jgi:hypothetical protein
MSKVVAVVAIGGIIGALAVAAVPSPRGYPWSFRFQSVAWIPGVPALFEWDAQRLAVRDHRAGRHFLFGFGEKGTQIGVDGCEVRYFRQYDPDRSDVPAWATHGLAGKATVNCGSQSAAPAVDFTLIEFGCIPSEAAYVFGTAYNEKIIDVAGVRQS